jgi:hypothetical protein
VAHFRCATFIEKFKTWSSGTVEDPAMRELEIVGFTVYKLRSA